MRKNFVVYVLALASICCMYTAQSKVLDTWKTVPSRGMLGAHVRGFAQGKNGDMVLLTRHSVYRSTNMGGSWFKANYGLPAHKDSIFCITANRGGDLYVGSNDGVYRSVDNGATWQHKNSGIARLKIEVMFVDSSGVIFAGAYAQVFRSLDSGNTWSENATDIPSKYKNGLPHLRYSYADGIQVSFGSWIFGTKSLGASWKQVSPANSGSDYAETEYAYDVETAVGGSISYDTYYNMGLRNYKTDVVTSVNTRTHAARIINSYISELIKWRTTFYEGHEYSGLVAVSNDSVLMGTCDHGIVKIALCATCDNDSNDLAGRYVNQGLKNLSITVLFKTKSGVIFCGTRGGGAYYSTNHGESWTESVSGLEEPSIYDVLLPKAGSQRFVAATGSGVYISNDNGGTWVRSVLGMTDYLVFTLEYTKRGTLLAGTENGVHRSLDSGNSWTFVKAPLPEYKDIYSSPTPYRNVSDFLVLGDNTILASTYSSIYWSKDDGKTWSLRGPAYPNPGYEARQTAISFDTASNSIFIAATSCYLTTTDTAKNCTVVPLLSGRYTAAAIQDAKTLFLAGGTNIMSVDLKVKPRVSNSLIGDISSNPYEFGVQAIKSDPLGHLMLGTMTRGAYFSSDGGTTWQPWNNGLFEKDILGFVQDDSYYLYALTANNGIYKTERPTASLDAPLLISPVVDSITAVRTLTFEWKSVADAQRYQLQVSLDSLFSTKAVDDKNIQTTSKSEVLPSSGTYYWKVRGTHGALLGAWSDVRRLDVQSMLPAKVELVRPIVDSLVAVEHINLEWNQAQRADSYTVQISNDTVFSTLHTSASGIASLGVQSNSLQSHSLYYWRVQGQNSQGNGDWSDVWKFTTSVIETSVDLTNDDGLALIPNPASEKLSVSGYPGRSISIRVFDVTGRTLLQSESRSVDVSTLENGLYCCVVTVDERMIKRTVQVMK